MSKKKSTDNDAEFLPRKDVPLLDVGAKREPRDVASNLVRPGMVIPEKNSPVANASTPHIHTEVSDATSPVVGGDNEGLETEPAIPESEKQHCLNCTQVLLPKDKYCGNCGQKVTDIRVTLWNLIGDFFAQQFSVDGKLFRSVSTLMTRPGKLTIDFCKGRRARYFTPIQVYLLTGVIFFLMIDVFSNFDSLSAIQVDSTGIGEVVDYEGTKSIKLGLRNVELTAEQYKDFVAASPKELPQFFAEININMNAVEMFFARGAHQLLQPGGLEAFVKTYVNVFSQSVLFMMPVFGFLVYGLYSRKSEGLVQAVVFSAHIHSFNYIVLVFISILSLVLNTQWLRGLLCIANFGYLVVASKNVFGGSYVATLVKSSVALFCYFIVVTIFVILLLPIVFLAM